MVREFPYSGEACCQLLYLITLLCLLNYLLQLERIIVYTMVNKGEYIYNSLTKSRPNCMFEI